MHCVTKDDLPLARLYRWERERAERIFLTQPFGGGKVRDWTWDQMADEVRRMAAYLKAQDWPAGIVASRSSLETVPGGSWRTWPFGWPGM